MYNYIYDIYIYKELTSALSLRSEISSITHFTSPDVSSTLPYLLL